MASRKAHADAAEPRMFPKPRVLLWNAHRWIGLVCLLPFLVLALTGLALLIEHGGFPWYRAHTASSTPPAIDMALGELARRLPGGTPQLAVPAADGQWTVRLLGPERQRWSAAFDGKTGHILHVEQADTGLHDILLGIHNSLLAGVVGRMVLLATALGVVLTCLSGFAIMKQRLAVLRRPPWRLAFSSRSFHKWAGLVGFLFILLSGGTGALLQVFQLGAAGRPSPHQATKHPTPEGSPALAAIARKALALRPRAELQAIMPGDAGRPVTVFLLDRRAVPWHRSETLLFDRRTGSVLPANPTPAILGVMIAVKSFHTGLWGSTAERILYIVMALFPIALTITGAWQWATRRRRRSHGATL